MIGKDFGKNKFEIISFASIFVITTLYALGLDTDISIGDTSYYVTIGDSVFHNGSFDITRFPETFRGYFFPLFLQLLKHSIVGLGYGWVICSSLMIAYLFSHVIPIILGNRVDSPRMLLGTIMALILYLGIWGDTTVFPLSDLPAFLGEALCIMKFRILINESDWKRIIILSLVIGAIAYATYNTRVVYIVGVIIALGTYMYFSRKDITKVVISVLLMLLGASIVMLPQCVINRKWVGEFSPKVYTAQLYNYSHALQMQQVFWGISYPRYETYVGDTSYFPEYAVHFIDDVGSEIIEREGITEENMTIKTWVYLVFKYPLDMVGIYTRHFLNVMTPLYRHIYIYNIYTNKIIIIVVSILAWIIAGIKWLIDPNTNRNSVFCDVIALALPAIIQTAGAPETRFFLPIYMLLYTYLGISINYASLWKQFKKKWVSNTVLVIVIMVVWIALLGDTLANCRKVSMLINDSDKYFEWQDK